MTVIGIHFSFEHCFQHQLNRDLHWHTLQLALDAGFTVAVLLTVAMAEWMYAGVSVAPVSVLADGLLQISSADGSTVILLLMSLGFELNWRGGPNSPHHRVVVEHVDILWQ